MDRLKTMLTADCFGVARAKNGDITKFRQHGVADLIALLEACPGFLDGALVADSVVGRGAALLMIKGRVSHIYARVISAGALDLLTSAGIKVDYDERTPFISNRRGDGMCPIERLTLSTTDPDEAYKQIKQFITQQHIDNNEQH